MADEGNSATRPANEFARIKADVLHVVFKDPRKTTFYVCKAVEVVSQFGTVHYIWINFYVFFFRCIPKYREKCARKADGYRPAPASAELPRDKKWSFGYYMYYALHVSILTRVADDISCDKFLWPNIVCDYSAAVC